MNFVKTVVVVSVAAATATPAFAADPATLSCVMRETPETERSAIVESARALVANPKQRREIPPVSRTAVHAAAMTCQKRHEWSDKARAAAEDNTVATLGLGPARAAVTAAGVDPDRVITAGRSMTKEQREGVMKGSPDAIKALFAALERQGLAPALDNSDALAGATGALLALLSFLDGSQAAFVGG